jgi:hypothetical protein
VGEDRWGVSTILCHELTKEKLVRVLGFEITPVVAGDDGFGQVRGAGVRLGLWRRLIPVEELVTERNGVTFLARFRLDTVEDREEWEDAGLDGRYLLVVVEPVGGPNRLRGLAVRPTGKSSGEYRRVGLSTAGDTRPVLDSKIRYQETSQQEQDDADSVLYGSSGDG